MTLAEYAEICKDDKGSKIIADVLSSGSEFTKDALLDVKWVTANIEFPKWELKELVG